MSRHCHRSTIRGKLLSFLIILFILGIPNNLLSFSENPRIEDPVSDSIIQQQRDSMLFKLNLEYLNGVNDNWTPYQLISIIEEILEIDPELYNHWFNLGIENIRIHEYQTAIEALESGLALYPTGDNATLEQIYINLSFCYHKIDKHQKEHEILDFLSRLYPEQPEIIGRYAVCAHSRMRFQEAKLYQEQLVSILRDQQMNESDIMFYLGRLYLNTDYLEAEKHFRTAFQYDPGNIEKMGALAWVLIRNALKIDEGMALIEKAIAADPDNAIYLHQQGYGFYAKGNYEDALINLYNARDLYQQYSYELDNHIRMVEEAIASPEE